MSKPLVVHYEAQRIFRERPYGMDVVAMRVLEKLVDAPEIAHVFAYVANAPVAGRTVLEHPRLTWCELKGLPYPVFEQVALPAAIFNKVNRYSEKGLAHAHVGHFTSNTAPLLSPVPFVATIHDVIYMDNDPELGGSKSSYQKWGRVYRRWNVPRIAGKARRVLTVSHYEKKRLCDVLGLRDERVQVAYNGVAPEFFERHEPAEVEAVLAKLKIRRPYILFLANVDPKKNSRRMLEAFALARRELGGSHRLLTSSVKPEAWAEMTAGLDADTLGAIDRFPFVSNKELRILYCSADLYVYPSLLEGFGLPLLEAFASETPVVSARAGALPEVGGDHARYVDPRDVKAMADGIVAAIRNPPDAARRRAALDYARGFTWERTAQATIAAYRDAALKPEEVVAR